MKEERKSSRFNDRDIRFPIGLGNSEFLPQPSIYTPRPDIARQPNPNLIQPENNGITEVLGLLSEAFARKIQEAEAAKKAEAIRNAQGAKASSKRSPGSTSKQGSRAKTSGSRSSALSKLRGAAKAGRTASKARSVTNGNVGIISDEEIAALFNEETYDSPEEIGGASDIAAATSAKLMDEQVEVDEELEQLTAGQYITEAIQGAHAVSSFGRDLLSQLQEDAKGILSRNDVNILAIKATQGLVEDEAKDYFNGTGIYESSNDTIDELEDIEITDDPNTYLDDNDAAFTQAV
jgi:hypothetical protein